MACYSCEKRQTDPAKGKSPWARFVTKGEQVLMCPECQDKDPNWRSLGDCCPECESTKLNVVMGLVVCKDCGRDFERANFI